MVVSWFDSRSGAILDGPEVLTNKQTPKPMSQVKVKAKIKIVTVAENSFYEGDHHHSIKGIPLPIAEEDATRYFTDRPGGSIDLTGLTSLGGQAFEAGEEYFVTFEKVN